MNYLIKTLFAFIFCISHTVGLCQNDATTIVKSFGESMKGYYVENDVASYKVLNNLVKADGVKCVVRDKISSDSEHGSDKNSIEIETYLNIFEKWSMSNNLDISMGNIRSIQCKEPTYGNTNIAPLKLASANFKVRSDNVDYNLNNIYAVRGDNITWIEDENSSISLISGLYLYDKGDYNRAFQVFRDLTYSDDNKDDYYARYYTIIMEVKKEGCSNIHPKLRDIEAAWLCARDLTLCNNKLISIDHPIVQLASSLSIDYKKVPLGNTNMSFLLLYMPPFSQGLMISADKKGLYGYVDMQNKEQIKHQYEFACSFNNNGLALVKYKNKLGYINNSGDYIIPNEYDDAYPFFKNNRTFAIKDNVLCLITDDNHIIRKRSGYTSIIAFNYQEDYVCVYREDKKIDVIDFNGNYIYQDYDDIQKDFQYVRLYKDDKKVSLKCKFF